MIVLDKKTGTVTSPPRKPKIVAIIPHYSNMIYTDAAWSILQQVKHFCDGGMVACPSLSKNLADIREDLVEVALRTDATHFLWLDGDQIFPKDMTKRLLEMDKDIACAWVLIRQSKTPNVYMCEPATGNLDSSPHGYAHHVITQEEIDKHIKDDPIQKVDRCGFGSVLVKREVFEKMSRPWFGFDKYHQCEDLYFFDKAREMGYETWVDYRLRCLHISIMNI